MNKSIYPERSQAATQKLASSDPERIMVVPIDFAKNIHEAQLCRATGEYLLKKPLMVYNTLAGLEFLKRKIEGNCKKYGIELDSVIVCGEDPPTFAVNFIHWLEGNGLTFVRVNAKEASEFRKSSRASTNTLDLDGIAQAAILRRGYKPMDYSDVFASLKFTSRARRQLVKQMTVVKNQIHQQIDVLFPGFLSKANTGLQPFNAASLELFENNFTMKRIARMRPATLVGTFKKHRLKAPEVIAAKVQTLAGTATPPPPELAMIMSESLTAFSKLLRGYESAIKRLEENCAKLLVQTPCFMLLTFPAIKTVTASEIASELGDPDEWHQAKETASYAGIVRRTKTTGDPDKSQSKQGGKLPWNCNHRLKNSIMWVAMHVKDIRHPIRKISTRFRGDHRLRTHANRKEAENGKYRLSTAKKFVRMMTAVVKGRVPYMSNEVKPESMDDAMELTKIELASAIHTFNEKTKGIDLSDIPDERNIMKQWIDKTTQEFELDKLEL
jgi:transposase